jgi:hypothetical protein
MRIYVELRHLGRACAAALSAVLTALALQAAAQPAAAQQTYVTIPVALNSKAFRAVLPYREPFFVSTTSDLTIVTLAARHRERNKTEKSTTKDLCKATQGENQNKKTWIEPGPESLGGGKAGDTLYIRVPELEANRRYVFCIESKGRIEGAALTAFQQTAAGILDETLKEFDRELRSNPSRNPGQIDTSAIALLKRRLARELVLRTGREIVVTDTLSPFDTTRTGLSKGDVARLNQILEAQAERASVIGWIEENTKSIITPGSAFLGWAPGDTALEKLIAAETQRKLDSIPVSGVQVARALATARALHGASVPVLRAVVHGVILLEPTAVPPTADFLFEDVWRAEQLAENRTQLDASAERLQELLTLVAAIRSDPALRASVGWTPHGAAALHGRLRTAISSVGRLRNDLGRLNDQLLRRERLIQESARSVGSQATRQVSLEATSILDFQARATSTINADLGVAYVTGIEAVVPYFGVNFYPNAINKRVPLRYAGGWDDRFALTLGLTAVSIAREGDRDNLFSSFGLLAGVGWRIADPVRVAFGGVFMRDVSDDPFDNSRPVVWTPFVSASLDADVRSALGKIADRLF